MDGEVGLTRYLFEKTLVDCLDQADMDVPAAVLDHDQPWPLSNHTNQLPSYHRVLLLFPLALLLRLLLHFANLLARGWRSVTRTRRASNRSTL